MWQSAAQTAHFSHALIAALNVIVLTSASAVPRTDCSIESYRICLSSHALIAAVKITVFALDYKTLLKCTKRILLFPFSHALPSDKRAMRLPFWQALIALQALISAL